MVARYNLATGFEHTARALRQPGKSTVQLAPGDIFVSNRLEPAKSLADAGADKVEKKSSIYAEL